MTCGDYRLFVWVHQGTPGTPEHPCMSQPLIPISIVASVSYSDSDTPPRYCIAFIGFVGFIRVIVIIKAVSRLN